VSSELGSDHLEAYFAGRSGFYITSFCFFEALSVLKRKMLSKVLEDRISRKQYFDRCWLLLHYLRRRIHIDDPDISSLETLGLAEKLAKQYDLDLSDALQLITVKHGKFRKLDKESRTVLITSDQSLAKAAEAEGLQAWNPEKESEPT
jgi:predicted nucleic acid-binding protein